jgi:hypothetical protein
MLHLVCVVIFMNLPPQVTKFRRLVKKTYPKRSRSERESDPGSTFRSCTLANRRNFLPNLPGVVQHVQGFGQFHRTFTAAWSGFFGGGMVGPCVVHGYAPETCAAVAGARCSWHCGARAVERPQRRPALGAGADRPAGPGTRTIELATVSRSRPAASVLLLSAGPPSATPCPP